jgi:cation:H+ antiporter
MWIAIAAVGSIVVFRGSDLLESSAERRAPSAERRARHPRPGRARSGFERGDRRGDLQHLGDSWPVGHVVPGGMATHREVVYKDAQFYMPAVAVFVLALIYNDGPDDAVGGALACHLTRPLVLLPIALYALYVLI